VTDRGPVLISGMFDMDNYGDLLFPVVAGHRLGAQGYRIQPVAPSARRAAFADALTPVDIEAMMTEETPISGIVIGGGYIIHANSLGFLDRYQDLGAWCGVGLWLGATLAAGLRDVPVVWNAPGAPHPFTRRQGALVTAALRAASYASVRDRGSHALLAPPEDIAMEIVPDPIVDLPKVWPKAGLAEDWRALLARKGLTGGDPQILAVHLRDRSIAGLDRSAFGAALRALADSEGLTPMLVAVGESHNDPAVARSLADAIGTPLLMLDDPLSLREITAAFAHSTLYVGASLHGYIVSSAYGVPGILVGRPRYNKFMGFLEHIDRTGDFAGDWDEAFRLAAARRRSTSQRAIIPASVSTALDGHWRRILEALDGPDRHSERRRDFALALLAAAIRGEGPGWAMDPILNNRMRFSAAPAASPRHDSALR
jgi:hypothetical protein